MQKLEGRSLNLIKVEVKQLHLLYREYGAMGRNVFGDSKNRFSRRQIIAVLALQKNKHRLIDVKRDQGWNLTYYSFL